MGIPLAVYLSRLNLAEVRRIRDKSLRWSAVEFDDFQTVGYEQYRFQLEIGELFHRTLKRLAGAVVIFAIASASPVLAKTSVEWQNAESAIAAKEYTDAGKILTSLANSGDAKAATRLGELYYMRPGLPQDYVKARYWLQKAVDGRNARAMGSLAYLLSSGLGGARDEKKCIALNEKAAELGDDYAQFNMGTRTFWGLGCKKNYYRAFQYFQASEKQGRGDAECFLAHMYEEGFGVQKNPKKAAALLKSSRAHDPGVGEYQIGRTYLQGRGTPINYKIAYKWLSMGAADGNEHAMNDLGLMYSHGYGVKKDRKKALELYLKAEKNGCPYAKLNVAGRYEAGDGLPKDLNKAKALYAEAAEQGSEVAAHRLKILSGQ
ncbi:MAG: SEL1-like repeat protein [Cyanobacteria bacterium REEB67]|nr:SEL1-like repeat protein [Cyanobacteria bacterium REEB67]